MKNVKGFIGLFAGLTAFILIGIALFVVTNAIPGSAIKLHSGWNVTLALIGGLLGVIAIVFGIMACRHKDRKGPRKAGIIIGVFAILISLSATGICALSQAFGDYANNVPGNALSESMKPEQREDADKIIKAFQDQYPAQK